MHHLHPGRHGRRGADDLGGSIVLFQRRILDKWLWPGPPRAGHHESVSCFREEKRREEKRREEKGKTPRSGPPRVGPDECAECDLRALLVLFLFLFFFPVLSLCRPPPLCLFSLLSVLFTFSPSLLLRGAKGMAVLNALSAALCMPLGNLARRRSSRWDGACRSRPAAQVLKRMCVQ
ncbi:unnamed protein product [Discosporangium mesarthrocarpum]